jgi:hypothetical protein
MTTRVSGFLVTLDQDLREDDAEGVRLAITQLRGVLSVSDVPADPIASIAYTRVRADLEDRLWRALRREPT